LVKSFNEKKSSLQEMILLSFKSLLEARKFESIEGQCILLTKERKVQLQLELGEYLKKKSDLVFLFNNQEPGILRLI
jgi:hypothetical protein